MVTIVVIDENDFNDFIVSKNVGIGIDSVYSWISCLLSCRKSRVKCWDFLGYITVIIDDSTESKAQQM